MSTEIQRPVLNSFCARLQEPRRFLQVVAGPRQVGKTTLVRQALAMLAQQDGLLSSELAQRMQLDRSRTSRAITSLVAKKLLLRTPRPGDRRQATLVLTSAGRTLVEELFPQVQAINERLLSVLAPSDAQQLDLLLDALQRSADQADGQGGLPKANRRLGRRPARAA